MARHLYDVEVKGRPIRRGCLFWWVGSRLLPLSQHIGLTQRRLRPSNESGPRARGTIVVQRWQPFSFLIEWSWASNECCSQFTDLYPCLACRTEDCVNWPKTSPCKKWGAGVHLSKRLINVYPWWSRPGIPVFTECLMDWHQNRTARKPHPMTSLRPKLKGLFKTQSIFQSLNLSRSNHISD